MHRLRAEPVGRPAPLPSGIDCRQVQRFGALFRAAQMAGAMEAALAVSTRYANDRIQFGRPIAMFQAVKHHCANMAVASELATSAVWDAAKAASTGGDQLTYAAAVAATLAAPAAHLCANLSTQVHGGIAITWEHDLHLFMRRSSVLLGYLDHRMAKVPPEGRVRAWIEGVLAQAANPDAASRTRRRRRPASLRSAATAPCATARPPRWSSSSWTPAAPINCACTCRRWATRSSAIVSTADHPPNGSSCTPPGSRCRTRAIAGRST